MEERDMEEPARSDLDRRTFLKSASVVIAAGAAPPLLRPGTSRGDRRMGGGRGNQAPSLNVTHGVAVGDVSADRSLIWCRGSGEGRMQVVFGGDAERVAAGKARHSRSVPLTAERDFIGQVPLDGLEPGRRHHYQVVLKERGARAVSMPASFSTPPLPDHPASVRFAWGGDTGQGMANRPPFPAFSSIADESPAFFIFNGDTIYADSTTPVGGAAKSVPEYWAKYKENRVDPFLQRLLATTSVVANWDDHEVTNDFRGPTEPLMPLGNRAFHDYWPLSVGPERIYRSLRWGRELEVFVLDTRQYADPLEASDGPAKTLLGEAQRAGLATGVAESDARWKVLVTSSPLSIIRSDDLHQDDWVSYEHELGTLLSGWRAAGVKNLVWLTCDVHWAQAISYPEWGMWEFVGCPIGANPRRAARPLSATFGPQERFLGLNERYYGSVEIDARAGTMTVDLKLQNGTLKHREVITGV